MNKIPLTISEAIQELLNFEGIEKLKENPSAIFHHGLGREIRNDWKLWFHGSLYEEFNSIGIHHADDMSGILIEVTKRILNKEPIKLKEQVNHYINYWKEINE